MYNLISFSQNIKNVFRIAAPYIQGTEIKSSSDLRKPYLDFLSVHQKEYPVNYSQNRIITDSKRAQQLSKAFSASRINDLHQEQMVGEFYNSEEQAIRVARVELALEQLHKMNFELWDLFRLCIHSILITGSETNQSGLKAHGGTSSKCIGLMWLTINHELSTQDIVEMLIHELTHTLIFIDELSHPQFRYDDIAKEETWALSAILNRTRPMDKVIHSIVVATEVMLSRKIFLKNDEPLRVHPHSDRMCKSTLDAIQSVLDLETVERVCLPRSIHLIQECQRKLLA